MTSCIIPPAAVAKYMVISEIPSTADHSELSEVITNQIKDRVSFLRISYSYRDGVFSGLAVGRFLDLSRSAAKPGHLLRRHRERNGMAEDFSAEAKRGIRQIKFQETTITVKLQMEEQKVRHVWGSLNETHQERLTDTKAPWA